MNKQIANKREKRTTRALAGIYPGERIFSPEESRKLRDRVLASRPAVLCSEEQLLPAGFFCGKRSDRGIEQRVDVIEDHIAELRAKFLNGSKGRDAISQCFSRALKMAARVLHCMGRKQ